MAGLSAQTLDGFIIINLPVHIYLAYPEALSVGLILGRFFSVDKKHSSFFLLVYIWPDFRASSTK